jgi:hypothetical protein
MISLNDDTAHDRRGLSELVARKEPQPAERGAACSWRCPVLAATRAQPDRLTNRGGVLRSYAGSIGLLLPIEFSCPVSS